MRWGIVLGGGGTAGYGWHSGVLAGLAEAVGLDARTAAELVGTSAGSYAAAYLRADFSGSDLLALAVGDEPSPACVARIASVGRTGELATPARPTLRAALRPAAPGIVAAAWRARRVPSAGALIAGLLPVGHVSAEPYLAPLRRLFDGLPWPAGLRIPTVRLDDGVRTVFDGRGGDVSVADAVAASSAVPAYMEPVEIDGTRYVDGSAHAPTNADLLVGAGLDLVIVSAPMSPPPGAAPLRRDLPLRAWAQRQLRREIALLARSGVQVLTLAPSARSRETMAAGGMSEAIRAPAARAGYAQVLASASALAAQLSG